MGETSPMRKVAEAIADRALNGQQVDETCSLSLSEALEQLRVHSEQAQAERNGRELTLFEREPARVGRLVDLLVAGNYRDTAARIAGISERAIRGWLEKADAGDGRYGAVAEVVRIGEALAESKAVRNVMKAGEQNQFWTASATYLERKYPEKWGRRQSDADTPRVIVQFGVSADQVRIGPLPQFAPKG